MTELRLQIQAKYPQLLPHQVTELLNMIADVVEKRGELRLDWDPGETSDWLRSEASGGVTGVIKHPCCRMCLSHFANKEKNPLLNLQFFIVCKQCGNKRCPKADNHNFQCTNSNEP